MLPPPIIAPTPFNVGDMVGFGPSPGWQYMNAVKVGVRSVPIPNTTPQQFEEVDDLEYIHPQWDKKLDYSKPNMPTRVWLNGMLYSPGRWLTTVKRGIEPNKAECSPGDPRFRIGMNYPAQDDPTDRVINRSHAFRVWKPYSNNHMASVVDMSVPDGAAIIVMPICTAHSINNYSTDSRRTTIYGPSVLEPYEVEKISSPPAYVGGPAGQGFAIKNYNTNKPEDTPLSVSSKTGKMTSEKIICVNSESDFGDEWLDTPYAGSDSYYWHSNNAHLGISLSNIFTQSKVTNSVLTGIANDGDDTGYKVYTFKDTLSIGAGAPEIERHLVGIQQYIPNIGWNQDVHNVGPFDNASGGYGTSLDSASRYGSMANYPAESHYTKVGTQWQFEAVIVDPPDDVGVGYSRSSYKETVKRNLFLLIQHPLFFKRTATIQSLKSASSYTRDDTWPDCNTSATTVIYNTLTYTRTEKKLIPKQHSISIGGSSPSVAPTGGFQDNTYYKDAHSLGSFTMVTETKDNYTYQRGGGTCPGGRDHNDNHYTADSQVLHVTWSI